MLPRTCFPYNTQLLTPAGSFLELVTVAIRWLENLAGPADAKGNLAALPLRQPLAHGGIEVGLQGFGHRIEVRVRIKNLKTVAHECSLLACIATSVRLSITRPSALVNIWCLPSEFAICVPLGGLTGEKKNLPHSFYCLSATVALIYAKHETDYLRDCERTARWRCRRRASTRYCNFAWRTGRATRCPCPAGTAKRPVNTAEVSLGFSARRAGCTAGWGLLAGADHAAANGPRLHGVRGTCQRGRRAATLRCLVSAADFLLL